MQGSSGKNTQDTSSAAVEPVLTPYDQTRSTNTVPAVPPIDRASPLQNELRALPALDNTSTTASMIECLVDDDQTNNPHAFIVMPFGKKEDSNRQTINFDLIYQRLIKPAVEEAGFEAFRADEETISGDILTDMFQELLLAELVIVDMSIDNANVFYELGVRHAFRKRGIVHIQSGRSYMPFDVFNVRTMPYHVDDNGEPDDTFLNRDRQNLIRITRDTWDSDTHAVHSPIYNLLTGLTEPDRQKLRTPLATTFWSEFNEWEQRIAIAKREKRVGDILLLTEEISNPLFKEDAVALAGNALKELGRPELALQQYRSVLRTKSKHNEFRREEAVILNKMGRVDEAIIKLESLLTDEPNDTRARVFLGRIYRSIWEKCWADSSTSELRQKGAYDSYHWIIKSIDIYLNGYHLDLNKHESGIKALCLSCLLIELDHLHGDSENDDPDIKRIREILPDLRSTLGFTLKAATHSGAGDYWSWASIASWHVTQGDSVQTISRAYRKALSYARKNIFYLNTTLSFLRLYESLGLYEQSTRIAIDIVQNEIKRIQSEGEQPRRTDYPTPETETEVFSILFCGHALDRPEAEYERFPPELENEVKRRIESALDHIGADYNEHAFVSGAACGGDMIFIEACIKRDMKVYIHMPYNEAQYIDKNIKYGGETWINRYYEIRGNPLVNFYYQEEKVGLAGETVDSYKRNTRWTMYASLGLGKDKLRMITLWDGREDTAYDDDGIRVSDMVQLTRQQGGQVFHLPINKFEYLFRLNTNMLENDPEARLRIETRVALLQNLSLFTSLHHVDLTQIAMVTEERPYEKGAVVTREGEKADGLYVIISGELSVRHKSDVGVEKEVARRSAGEYAGELALFYNEIRTATLVANTNLSLLVLSQENFQRVLDTRPETSQALTRALAARLIESDNAVVDTEALPLAR